MDSLGEERSGKWEVQNEDLRPRTKDNYMCIVNVRFHESRRMSGVVIYDN